MERDHYLQELLRNNPKSHLVRRRSVSQYPHTYVVLYGHTVHMGHQMNGEGYGVVLKVGYRQVIDIYIENIRRIPRFVRYNWYIVIERSIRKPDENPCYIIQSIMPYRYGIANAHTLCKINSILWIGRNGGVRNTRHFPGYLCGIHQRQMFQNQIGIKGICRRYNRVLHTDLTSLAWGSFFRGRILFQFFLIFATGGDH